MQFMLCKQNVTLDHSKDLTLHFCKKIGTMQVAARRAAQFRSFSDGSATLGLRYAFPFQETNSPEHRLDHSRFASSLTTKGIGHLIRKGTGGRSSVSGIVATVFGATGFLGRYVVQQLAKVGSQVLVPFRGSEDSPRHLKLMGDLGQIVPMKYDPRDESSIKAVMAKSNVVINLIGREYETRNFSYEDVNVVISEHLAKIAKEHGGIMRFIQVSCLGASPSSPSRMLRTKAAAEDVVLKEIPEATILRPAAMIGTEDRVLNKWAQIAKNWAVLPIIGDGCTKLQPVYVIDIAAAIIAALKDDGTSMGKTYELGGPEVFTMEQLVQLMFETIREEPRYIKIPIPIARLLALPRELLLKKVPFPLPTPVIFNQDYVDSLSVDNVVSQSALTFRDLGIIPRKLKGYPIEYLFQYRTGGPSYGATLGDRVSGAGF